MIRSKRLWTFPRLIWVLVAGLTFYLLGWPLIHNAWAVNHWQRLPCQVDPHTGEYSFSYNGRDYHGSRIDFWDLRPTNNAYENHVPAASFDASCYVPPGDPIDAPYHAVLSLDAPHHLDHAGPGLVIVALTFSVAILLTIAARRKSRRKKSL